MHLLAFNTANSAEALEGFPRGGMRKGAAVGSSDFPRTAATDPTLRRNVFRDKRTALLYVVECSVDDLSAPICSRPDRSV